MIGTCRQGMNSTKYANTQNKVAIADFFANHPVHRKLEEISRKLRTPAKASTRLETKWFYERSRGQYQNERLYLNKVKRDKKIKYQADNPIDNRVDTEYDEEWDIKLEETYNEVVAELKNMERSRNWPASKLAQIYWFTPNMTLEKLSNEIKICKSTSFTNVKKAKLHLRETLNNPFIEKE